MTGTRLTPVVRAGLFSPASPGTRCQTFRLKTVDCHCRRCCGCEKWNPFPVSLVLKVIGFDPNAPSPRLTAPFPQPLASQDRASPSR
jgi:hypothetical protein